MCHASRFGGGVRPPDQGLGLHTPAEMSFPHRPSSARITRVSCLTLGGATLLLAATLVACGGKRSSAPPPDASRSSVSKEGPGARRADAPVEALGVGACDEFIARYQRCVELLPEGQRADAREGMAQLIEVWRRSAGAAAERDTIAAACDRAAEVAAPAFDKFCPEQ